MKTAIALLFAAAVLPATPVLLYDGTLATSPSAQGWSFVSIPGGATQTAQAGFTNLSTTAMNGISAGYSIPPPFGIDLTIGVRLRFDVRVNSETHASTDRAGFSVILLSSTLFGIELGFWGGEVWAQNTNFTHGEGLAFDTMSAIVRYDLILTSLGYQLLANGNPLLSGALRNYSGQSTSPLAVVYSIPNFLFLGDDTTSAAANIDFAYADIEPVPEPFYTGLIGAILLAFGAGLRKKRVS